MITASEITAFIKLLGSLVVNEAIQASAVEITSVAL